MKVSTWNVNSLRVRLPHLIDWLASAQPDLVGLQETKTTDDNFPVDEIKSAGYNVIFSGQKTYNGVAILSRLKQEPADIVTDIPGLEDPQRRVLGAAYDDIYFLNLYVPNGSEVGSEKYDYKLDWLGRLNAFVKDRLIKYPKLIMVGDFNIAPEDIDVHDPKEWEGSVLVSNKERAAFKKLIALGLHDSFRLFNTEEKLFSWWDYRAAAFRRNRGLRIDHILVSDALKDKCTASYIDKEPRKLERPSDHTPVITEIVL